MPRRSHTTAPSPDYIARKLAEYDSRGYLPEWIQPYATVAQLASVGIYRVGTPTQRRDAARAAYYASRPQRPQPQPRQYAVESRSPSPPPRPVVAAAAAPAATIPEHIITQLREMQTALGRKVECPICMEEKEPADTTMTRCGHSYCAPCLSQLKAAARHERQWTCAVCRCKHSH